MKKANRSKHAWRCVPRRSLAGLRRLPGAIGRRTRVAGHLPGHLPGKLGQVAPRTERQCQTLQALNRNSLPLRWKQESYQGLQAYRAAAPSRTQQLHGPSFAARPHVVQKRHTFSSAGTKNFKSVVYGRHVGKRQLRSGIPWALQHS